MVEGPPPDPYQALGIAKDATTAQVKTAYKKAALKVHPDKAEDKAAAADAFHRINQAYEILSDPEKRHKYEEQLRQHILRREAFDRKGAFSRPPPSHAHPPPSAGHSRGNSDDPAARPSYFSPRPAAPPMSSYPEPEYVERRPKQPIYDDESAFSSRFDSYPRDGTSARKGDSSYTSSRRAPPKSSSRNDDPPRASVRQDKGASKSKEKERRATSTKIRDQSIRKERARDFNYGPSESETDASMDDRRVPPMESRARARSGDSDSYDERDRRTKYASQSSTAYDHIQFSPAAARARNEPPSGDYRREAFGSNYESSTQRRDAPEPERRSSVRPSLRRGSTSKSREAPAPPSLSRARAASYVERKPPSSAGAARMADHPNLYHSSTMPANGSKLSSMANGRSSNRRSDSDEDDDYPMKPSMRRAETLPMRPGPTRQNSVAGRRGSEAPQPIKTERTYPSDSRGVNDDSGYSTSSPSESPSTEIPQTAPAKTQTYTYSAKKSSTSDAFPRSSASEQFPGSTRERTPRTAQSERFPGPPLDDYIPEFRAPGFSSSTRSSAAQPQVDLRSPGTRARNSPSPHSRAPSSSKHFPPPSRSASYQPSRDSTRDTGRESDRERDAPPSRRPSLSRSNSATKSSSKPPSFSRASTGPLHVNTSKLRDGGRDSGRDSPLFGEVTSSPVDYHSSGADSGRERDRDRESSSRRRPSEDQRPSSARTSGRGSTSRATLDGKVRMEEKLSYATRQMGREDRSPRSPRPRLFP